jgi:hypothetical protein
MAAMEQALIVGKSAATVQVAADATILPRRLAAFA